LRVAATPRSHYATRSLASNASRLPRPLKEKIATDEIDVLIDEGLVKVDPSGSSLLPPESPSASADASEGGSQLQEQTQGKAQGEGGGPPPAQKQGKGKQALINGMPNLDVCHRLSVKSTRNNTHITLANPHGNIIYRVSGGSAGFKGANRASYECGYACATKALQKVAPLAEAGSIELHLFLNGFGQGREALYRALVAGDPIDFKKLVVAITDNTPLKIGGTRPKKARRL